MPASYPTSAKSFTTKNTTDTIQAAHVNDLQLEVTAIESDLIGGLPVARGGTGQTSYTVGDLLYADGTGSLAKLADVATGRVLASGGAGAAPAYTATPTIDSVTLSNGQIVFPATQNASSNANTLDDYEEGTWTPTDGSGAGLSFTNVEGQYIKIGQLVMAAASLTFPATADGTNARLNSFPFAASGTIALYGSGPNYTDDGTAWTLNLQPGGTHAFIYRLDGTAATNAALSGNILRFTVMYRATA